MSKEQNPLELINKELEEKTAHLQGLGNKVQEAHKFVQENEPNLLALNGAIQQLQLLKTKLTSPPDIDKPQEKEDNKH